MTTYAFRAPNGADINGTDEILSGTAAVSGWNGPDVDTDHQHGGGTDVDWDGQTTCEIVGATVFIDENGESWLSHHLIPDGPDALSTATLNAMRAEIELGAIVEQAGRVDAAVIRPSVRDYTSDETKAWANHMYCRMLAAYADLKDAAAALKAADLAGSN